MKKIILALSVLIFLFLTGCEKKVRGCTQLNALNFNSSANEDDGSCITKIYGCMNPSALNYNVSANVSDNSCTYTPPIGRLIFWTSSSAYQITVTIGLETQLITTLYSSEPTCTNNSGCAVFIAPTGIYHYTATNGVKNWSGTATSTDGYCISYLLN